MQESTSASAAGLGGPTAKVTITVNLVLNQPSVTNATTTDNTQTTSGLVITPNSLDTAFVTNFQITDITGGTLYLNNGVTQITNGEFITDGAGSGRTEVHADLELAFQRAASPSRSRPAHRQPAWAVRRRPRPSPSTSFSISRASPTPRPPTIRRRLPVW